MKKVILFPENVYSSNSHKIILKNLRCLNNAHLQQYESMNKLGTAFKFGTIALVLVAIVQCSSSVEQDAEGKIHGVKDVSQDAEGKMLRKISTIRITIKDKNPRIE